MIPGENKPLNEEQEKEMLERAEKAYNEFLTALGYEWELDSNMAGTPKRVAKMYVKEIAKGSYLEAPQITSFDNVNKYDGIVFQGNVGVKSLCSHHMMPFFGKAYVAYIPVPEGKIIGLSKINRIVEWFARRPQLQENLTTQIHDYIDDLSELNKGVAVMIKAHHTCVSLRGIEDDSTMMTTKLSKAFLDNENRARDEFYNYINNLK